MMMMKKKTYKSCLITIVVIGFLFVCSLNPIRLTTEYFAAKQVAVDTDKVVTTYSRRDPSLLTDVKSLKDTNLTSYVQWLDRNGKDPLEYAVSMAGRYEITIFGEMHWLQDNLTFFNKMIPDLYHRAGVTCIALECCIPQDNARLTKLVTADEFDRELALDIARNGDLWKNWGWKGYWDILETVWRLNQSVPEGSKKMRVVGIGVEMDGPSMAFVGMGGVPVPGSAWDKLRIFTLFDDLIRGGMVDGLYAANIARETIEKGERGVVLVGSAHSSLDQLYPFGKDGALFREKPRMGFMLHKKYGDRVFQIVFHNQGLVNSKRISEFIERVASWRDSKPFGCNIGDSPFAMLRDDKANHFQLQPTLCLSDIAAGYIYLKPISEQKRCEWIDDYISEDLFHKYKRYYEKKTGTSLDSPEDANKAFKSYKGW